jgi:hypothetical protein
VILGNEEALTHWGLLPHGKKIWFGVNDGLFFLKKKKLQQNSNTKHLDCRKSAYIFPIAFIKQNIKFAL